MAKITLYLDVPVWKSNSVSIYATTTPAPVRPEWCKRVSVEIDLPASVWKDADIKLPAATAFLPENQS